ncbi:E3 SUMO-protein ligase NSE2-like [Mercenaria mercenaria]|uniref:E3 SUMO-protein ligase NSE2-like n=1 Tax=Mercenaria mercenaria TaxID=6596 RepID=UPI001E1D9F34|nr:E3 SUMO-protein ligase NSE2-like [Mercenaria mercenaria]
MNGDHICITKIEPPKDVILVEHPENKDTNCFAISHTINTSPRVGDVQFVKEHVSVICPYTRCVMKEPVKNKICGHTFDKYAMMDYLKLSRYPRCPLAGCTNVKRLEASDFEVNKTVQLYIDRTRGLRQ